MPAIVGELRIATTSGRCAETRQVGSFLRNMLVTSYLGASTDRFTTQHLFNDLACSEVHKPDDLPETYAAGIDVDEVGLGVVADAAALE